MIHASNDTKALAQHCISKEDMIRIEKLVENLVYQKEKGDRVYQSGMFEAIMELDDVDDEGSLQAHITPKQGEETHVYRNRLS